MARIIAIIILAASLAACGAFSMLSDGLRIAGAVERELETTVGTKPSVGFNWNNGQLTLVTVTFPQLVEPSRLREVSDAVRASIKKNFPQKAQQIVLGFTLADTP